MTDSAPTGIPFIHLRVHSSYSLSEGALPIKQLAKLAAELKMPAIAIADTGNLFGALEFSETLAGKGIQPIIGCTLKIDLDDSEKEQPNRPGTPPKLPSVALLAKDEAGYRNLMRLTSHAWLEHGSQSEPHVGIHFLAAHAEGLICLTGGPDGPINEALADGQQATARRRVEALKAVFGDRLYVELQRHGTEAEAAAEPGLIDLAYELELPLVATNQAYFAKPDDFAAHDALICIAEGEVVAAEDRRRLTPEHYLKSPQEMATLFADLPEAVANTVEIARRCAFRPRPRAPILPSFMGASGEALDEAEELRRQAREGLKRRLESPGPAPGHDAEAYAKRLEFEIEMIIRTGFAGYFLIVSDFIKFAKSKEIPVGPGR